MIHRIKEIIQNSDMVLVGIGEEFDGERCLKQLPEYIDMKEKAETNGQEWMIPFLNRYYLEKTETDSVIRQALLQLSELIREKNYFVISVSTSDYILDVGLKEDRVVTPCGGSRKKQCADGMSCDETPSLVSREEYETLTHDLLEKVSLGNCPVCGKSMIFNNIYTDRYDERGYLELWQKYTKWLQGTLNKKLCILELGVGMQCPGVIRFPFEKIGYFNQKADFIRVHKNLYQLTEELKEKGISISENAVDWLASLC